MTVPRYDLEGLDGQALGEAVGQSINQLSQAIAATTSFSLELKVRRVGELWASRWQWQAKYKSYKQDIRCPQAGFETVEEALEDFIIQSTKDHD